MANERNVRIILGLLVGVGLSACAHRGPSIPALTQKACHIEWNWADDLRIVEHRVVVWSVKEGKESTPVTTRVPAPASRVGCAEAGAKGVGEWKTTVQACLKNGSCSQPTPPASFQIVGP